MRILLIEDHGDSGEALARLLKTRGHVVRLVETAEQALQTCQHGHFELVISDIDLPDSNGRELIQKIRQLCKVKAIAISGHTYPGDVAANLLAGFDAHLAKPFDLEILDKLIHQVTAENSEN